MSEECRHTSFNFGFCNDGDDGGGCGYIVCGDCGCSVGHIVRELQTEIKQLKTALQQKNKHTHLVMTPVEKGQ